MRLDDDGEAAYSTMDFMNGEVVIRNENHGYWNSNNMETYPNPFFIKLCKRLWYEHSDFMVIGECWGGHMFEHRQIILARSGVILCTVLFLSTDCSMFSLQLLQTILQIVLKHKKKEAS